MKKIILYITLIFSGLISSFQSFGQCPTFSGVSLVIRPADCIDGNEGMIVVTITGLSSTSTFRLYSGSAGVSPANGVTYSPAGALFPIPVNVLTISGIKANTYNIRYQRNAGGCIFTSGTNPNPLLTNITVEGPTPANVGGISNKCLSNSEQILGGSDPTSPNGLPSLGTWSLIGPSIGTFSDIYANFSNLTNLTLPGTYNLSWSVSIAGCNIPGSQTVSSVNFDIVKDPTITSSLTGVVCSGDAFIYSLNSTIIGSSTPMTPNLEWSRSFVVGISNASANQSTNSINETLINTTNLPIKVFYQLQASTPDIDGSGTFCTGTMSVLTVIVNPKPIINFVGNTTYCSNSNSNITLTSNIIGTSFNWTASVTSGFVNGFAAGTGNLINQNLSGNGVVTYMVTPIIPATSCPGNVLYIPVTVNPKPSITGLNAPPICSGFNTNISYNVSPSIAANFVWSAMYDLGLSGSNSGVSAGTSGTIAIPITNSTNNTLTGLFTITPSFSGTGCVGNSTTVSQIVYPLPIVTSTLPGSICSGNAFVRSLTSNIPSLNFVIIRSANPNVNETLSTQTIVGTAINDVLTSNTGNVETIIYTILPVSSSNCVGSGISFSVQVNPVPILTGTTTSVICANNTPTFSLSTIPLGSFYTWNTSSTGVTGASNQITSVLGFVGTILTGNGNVVYSITPFFGGCAGNAKNYVVTVNPTPTIAGIVSSTSFCGSGILTTTLTGANSYNTSHGTISGDILTFPFSSTTNITVTGNNALGNCFSSKVFDLVVNPIPILNINGNVTICLGQTTTLTATGANIYQWQPGNLAGSVQTITPASTTTYSIVGTNSFGCTATGLATVSVNTIPSVFISGNNSICLGSSSILTANGASTYVWLPGSIVGTNISVNPTTNTVYTVIGTNSGGCTASNTYVVTVNSIPTISGVANNADVCNGNSISITLSGANTYSSTQGTVFSNILTDIPTITTTYNIVGANGAGCTATGFVTITVNSLPIINIFGSKTICLGQSTTLTATGANIYQWQPGNLAGSVQTITPASTTTYSIVGTNSFGCTATGLATVSVNTIPSVFISGNNSICLGSSSILTANGASTYVWLPGSIVGTNISVNPTTNTIYTVIGTNSGGCTASNTYVVTVNSIPTISGVANNADVCNGNSISITLSGANTYSSTQGNVFGNILTDIPTITTTYNIVGANGAGCTATGFVTITVNSLPIINIFGSKTICLGQTTTLTATGANIYQWQPGNLAGSVQTITPAATTTYSIVGTNSFGCTATGLATVTVNTISGIVVAGNTLLCSGDNLSITLSGNATSYTVSPSGNVSGQIITDIPSTGILTYSVTGTLGLCNSFTTFVVTVNSAPVIAISGRTNVCSGQSASLTASGANTFTWNNSAFTGNILTVTPIISTVYTLSGTTGNCSTNITQTVVVSPSPAPPNVTSPINICHNSLSTPLITNGPVSTPLWYFSSITGVGGVNSISPSTVFVGSSSYYVTQTSSNCESQPSVIQVNVISSPTLTGTTLVSTCLGQSVILSIAGASTYVWQPGNLVGSSQIISPLSSTTYTVTGSIGICNSNKLIQVNIIPLPIITVSGQNQICSGDSSVLIANGANSYVWQPGNSSNPSFKVKPTSTTVYTVTGTSLSNCVAMALYTVTVNPSITNHTISGTQNFCQGILVNPQYTSNITNQTALGWAISAGSSSINSTGLVSWDPTFAGIATISATGFGCNGPNTSIILVTVNGKPTITSSAITHPTNCFTTDGSITVTGAGVGPLQYTNGFSNNAIGIFTNLSVGAYPIQISDAKGCFSTSILQTLTTTGQPDAPVLSSGGIYGACNPVPFLEIKTTSATPAGTYYYQLFSAFPKPLSTVNFVGSGAVNTGIPSFYQPSTTTGIHNYYAILYDQFGCPGNVSGPVSITILGIPTAPGVTNPTTPYCQNSANPQFLQTDAITPKWYTSSVGGTSIGTVNVAPSTSIVGVTNYFVSNTDIYGCESNRSMVTVSITSSSVAPCNCTATYSINPFYDNVICHNQSVQYFDPLIMTGARPFTLFLFNPVTNVVDTISGINTFSYPITIKGFNLTSSTIYRLYKIVGVKDANGCNATKLIGDDFGYVHYPSPTIIGINQPSPICQGNAIDITNRSQGEIPSVSNISQISYHNSLAAADRISPTNFTSNPTNITASGTYFYRYQADPFNLNFSCWAVAPINVLINPLPIVSLSGTQTICGGNSTSLIANLVSGSLLPNWEIVYSDGSLLNTLSGINSNPFNLILSPTITTNYSILSIKDGNGCENTSTANASVSVLPSTHPLCGNCTAKAKFIPGGNIGNNCQGSPTSYNLSISVTGASMFGLEILQNGANPLVFSNLFPDVNNFVTVPVNPTINTSYTISQVFVNTCSGLGSGTAFVSINPTPSLVGNNLISAVCGQAVDITKVLIDINSTTGSNTYWTNASLTNAVSDPTAITLSGIYYVKKTTSNGCFNIQSIQVDFPAIPSAIISGGGNICPGNSTTINFGFAGGNGNYIVNYTDGNSINTITTSGVFLSTTTSAIINKSYSISSFSDQNGCFGTFSGIANITMLPVSACGISLCSANANISVGSNTICSTTGTTLSFGLSGTAPFAIVYKTNGIPTTITGLASSTTIGINPIINTVYNIISVTDANCTNTLSGTAANVTINCNTCVLPTAPNLSITQISTSSINASWILQAGSNYNFDLARDNLFINSVAGAFGIVTNSNSFQISGLVLGQYFGRVTAINACGSTIGFNTVTVTNNMLNTTILGTQTIGIGGFAVLTVYLSGTGPFSNIIIDNGSPIASFISSAASNIFLITVNPSLTTTYKVTGYTDANNQSSVFPDISATVTVVNPQFPSVLLTAPFTTSCANGKFIYRTTVTNIGSGIPRYTWFINNTITSQSVNAPNVTFSGIANGDKISVLVSVSGALLTTNTIVSNIITSNISSQIATLSYLPVSCVGGSDGAIIISLNEQNSGRSFSYYVNSITGNTLNQSTIGGISAGIFVMTIQDNFNPTCFQILTGNPGISDFQIIRSAINPSCSGNDGTFKMAVVSQVHALYNATIKGISLSDTTIIFKNLTTTSTFGSILNTNITKLKYGIYSTQFEYGNCTTALFIDTLTGAQPPIANLGIKKLNVCKNQEFTLTTPGISGGSFSWFKNNILISTIPSNSITIIADSSAKYTVQVPGNNGCIATDFVDVVVSNLTMKVVSTQYTKENNVIVKWSITNVLGFPSDSLSIQRRETTPTIGNWLSVGNVFKTDSSFINIAVPTDKILYQYKIVGKSNNVCQSNAQNSILLKGSVDEGNLNISLSWNSYKYWKTGVKEYQVWRKIDNEPQYTLFRTVGLDTTLSLDKVTEGFDHQYRILAVSNEPIVQDSIVSWSNSIKVQFLREVAPYNAFSPNGDGVNETFVIKNIESYTNSELFIFNRWGTKVYYAKPYSNQWNGDGSPDGTYFFILNLGQDGKQTIKGNILIQR